MVYNKALAGCEDSLWKLEYGYNLLTKCSLKLKRKVFGLHITMGCTPVPIGVGLVLSLNRHGRTSIVERF